MIIEAPNTVQYDFFKILFSAFAGAFAAYIFSEIAKYFEKKYQEIKTYKKALFKIELLCNNLTDDISLNKNEFVEIKNRYERCLKENIVLIPGNKPFQLQYDDTILIDIKNEEILNDYYSLIVKLKRYNSDIKMINDSFEVFKSSVINATVSIQTYLDNYKNYVSKSDMIIKHLDGFEQKVFRLLAKTRILRLEKVSLIFLIRYVFTKENNLSTKRIDEELSVMSEERSLVKSEDKEFMSKINNKAI